MVKISKANYNKNKYFPRVREAVTCLLETKGYAAPVDVFVHMGLLGERDVLSWRQSRVDYLERVIQCNLSKTSRIMKVLRCHAEASKLRASQTVYKHRGKRLRFSKSGLRQIEEFYATHYLLPK